MERPVQPHVAATVPRTVRIGQRRLAASDATVMEMRERLMAVPTPEKSDIAFRASTMLRRAHADGRLGTRLRADFEDAVAMLLALGVHTVHE